MVRVELHRLRDDGSLAGFAARGHAGRGYRGQDVVCAGVSALTTAAVLGLQARLGLDPEVEMDDDEGYLRCRLEPGAVPPELWTRAQDLLETMALALRQIAEDYPENVRVEEVAV